MLAFKSLVAVALAVAAVAVQGAPIDPDAMDQCIEVHPDVSKVIEIDPGFTRTAHSSNDRLVHDEFNSDDKTSVISKIRYQIQGYPQFIQIATKDKEHSRIKVKLLTQSDKVRVRYFRKLRSNHTCYFESPKKPYKKILDVSYYSMKK